MPQLGPRLYGINVPTSTLMSRISRVSFLLRCHVHFPLPRFLHITSAMLKARDKSSSRTPRPDPFPFTSRRNPGYDLRKPPNPTSDAEREAMWKESLRLRLKDDPSSHAQARLLSRAVL